MCVCALHRDIVVGCCDFGALQVSFSCKLHRDEVDFKFVLDNFDVELVFALKTTIPSIEHQVDAYNDVY